MTKLLQHSVVVSTYGRWPTGTRAPIGSDSRIMAESHDLPVSAVIRVSDPSTKLSPGWA